jgi:hypothetical protein
MHHSIISEQFRLRQNVFVKSKWCWISTSISRINGDSAFGVTFQDEALVDSVDNHTLPDLIKGRRAPDVTATDDSKEAKSDCDDS